MSILESLKNNFIFRFAVKLGIATASVYYLKEQNVWKSSNDSVRILEKIKETCKPYVLEIKNQIPVEVGIVTFYLELIRLSILHYT